MAEDHGHHHHHSREEIGPAESDYRKGDTAGESLANALKVSFRLLTLIMVVVVIGFVLTGFKSIKQQEIGIIKVFGKVTGTAEPGLAYTWPFPVGDVQTVPTSEQSLIVKDFWLYEDQYNRSKPLTERTSPKAGLRPGLDGALFTGDRNLLHVEFDCKYVITDGEGAKAYVAHLADPREMIRSAICQATITTSADMTADDIKRGGRAAFVNSVRMEAQNTLNNVTTVDGEPYEAVRITKLAISDPSGVTPGDAWPLRALASYEAAQKAVSEREQTRNAAIADARKALNEAAGANYEKLVGSPEEFTGEERPPAGETDLIGQYLAAKDTDQPAAETLLDRIDMVLTSSTTGGKAAQRINGARAYKTQVIQAAESRAKRFQDLLAEYEKTPQFWLERRWADVRDAILSSPTMEKYYITTGDSKTVLRINEDPEVRKEVQREMLRGDSSRTRSE
jgi:regulator of protease activity HflC (stomatin/prohibitin superfamily)